MKDITPVTVPPEIADWVILLANGELLIAEPKKTDARVLSFESNLRKRGAQFERKIVSLEELAEKLQKQQVASDKVNETLTQQEAMDLFREAAKKRASDIHIRVNANYADVLFRVHGSLVKHTQWERSYADAMCRTIYASLADVADATYKPSTFQDARIGNAEGALPTGLHGIRVASGPKTGGTIMVLRLLYEDTDMIRGGIAERLRKLGYDDSQIQLVRFMMRRPSGINIVSGPTGSGKSTGLKHVLEAIGIERPDMNILAVEDPPEYPIANVVQIPVTNAETEDERRQKFGEAIRAALRMDPDVIMIGEIRDRESARLALKAAMTGHQVWSTLHTNSAFNIINRLVEELSSVEMVDPLRLIADSTVLTGMMFQRLVKTLCPHCKLPLEQHRSRVPSDVFDRLMKIIPYNDFNKIYVKGDGCEKCDGKGVSGRTVLAEVVVPDPKMLELLRTKGVDAAQDYWVRGQNGKTIVDHAISKVVRGIIDPLAAEEAVGPLTSAQVFEDRRLEASELDELVGELGARDDSE